MARQPAAGCWRLESELSLVGRVILVAGIVVVFIGIYALYYSLIILRCLSLVQRALAEFAAHLIAFGCCGLGVLIGTGSWDSVGAFLLFITIIAVVLASAGYFWERRVVWRLRSLISVMAEPRDHEFDRDAMAARRKYVKLRRHILGKVAELGEY